MEKRHISLKDLATELNVSISTVSRALKNHPDISKELSLKIQALAKLRNYSPNPYAMGLLKQTTKTIGVIVPDIVTHFYASIIGGIESFTREHGYFIVISSSQESTIKESESIHNLLNMRVDGLIICLSKETKDYSLFDNIIKENVPLVFFDRVCRTNEISSVVANNYEAAKEVTLHFHQMGCRRIAHIGGPRHLNITKERIAGYKAGLKDCGLNYNDEYLVYCDLTPNGARKATLELLNKKLRPDAIFGVNDTVAFSAMKVIKEKGYKIPDDIAIVGFTDEFHATIVDPELTSVMHPTFEMGEEAARLLIDQLEQTAIRTSRQVTLKTKLVVRQSSSSLKKVN